MLELIENTPFDVYAWPGSWVWAAGVANNLEVVQFSRRFDCGDEIPERLHISADNRYKLYLNGEFVGLGPQCGTLERYFFDTYNLPSMDECVVTAVVWHDRDNAPSSQISSRPGFFAIEEYANGEMVRPVSNWRCRRWHGNGTLLVPEEALHSGSGYELAGFTVETLCPSREVFRDEFESVIVLGHARNHGKGHPQLLMHWNLHPRTIPAMRDERQGLGICRKVEVGTSCDDLKSAEILRQEIESLTGGQSGDGISVTIPANSSCRFLLDTEKLVVGYPVITTNRGAGSQITLTYQEALQSKDDDVSSKGNRNEIENRVMVGVEDKLYLDGGLDVVFEPFIYRCWRYIEIDLQTSNEPLELKSLGYRSTGYPLELTTSFEANEWFTRLVEPGFRTLQLCANETFMDCPYYERLQYIGDTRLQALMSYVLCGDERLACEAIEMFHLLISSHGLTHCNYPNRFKHSIPLFALFYIAMLNDFLMWRGDVNFVAGKIDVVEQVLDSFKKYSKDDGLIGKMPGWAFVDWTAGEGWLNGEPKAASEGDSYLVSFFYLYAMQQAANLYQGVGDDVRHNQINEQIKTVRETLRSKAFDAERQVFVDDPSGKYLSQHTNILAILTGTYLGVVDGQVLLDNILNNDDISEATVYFKFYLYEAMYYIGRADLIWPDLKLWHDMLDCGLTTFAETPEPSRSDCHGWSSHPLYHFIASIMGVRPAAVGCSEISIRPMLGFETQPELPEVLGARFLTADGECYVRLTAVDCGWDVYTELPAAIRVSDFDLLV